jgi:hypothetical protein
LFVRRVRGWVDHAGHGPWAILDLPTLVPRYHDEQLIADLNSLSEIWIEGLSIVSND